MWRIETELPAKENPHKRGLARGLCDKRTGNDKPAGLQNLATLAGSWVPDDGFEPT